PALRDLAPELERDVLHDAEDHRAHPHVAAGVDQAGRHRTVERRADVGVLELDAELVTPRAPDLRRGADLLVLLRRDDALVAQRARPALVGRRLLEAGLRLPQPGLDLVLAHAREGLSRVHAVPQVG